MGQIYIFSMIGLRNCQPEGIFVSSKNVLPVQNRCNGEQNDDTKGPFSAYPRRSNAAFFQEKIWGTLEYEMATRR